MQRSENDFGCFSPHAFVILFSWCTPRLLLHVEVVDKSHFPSNLHFLITRDIKSGFSEVLY